jgi:hypothetical protein
MRAEINLVNFNYFIYLHSFVDLLSGLLLFIYLFIYLLDIFFIYILNAIPKVPYALSPPCSPIHPLSLLGPGIPLYRGI